jgi:hypothetical protein
MRPLACLTFLALTSTAIGAQQPASQPTGNPIVQSFTSTLPYGRWLIEAFDSIPESKYGYKPTPVQQSVGYIAQHLENANYQLCERMSGVKHPLSAKDSLADTVKAKWPKDTLTATKGLPRTLVRALRDRSGGTLRADRGLHAPARNDPAVRTASWARPLTLKTRSS